MGILKATCVLTALTGLAEDNCVNTLYFNGPVQPPTPTPPTAGQIDSIAARLTAFYNDMQLSGSAIASFIGEQMSRVANANSFDFYWTDGVEPPATWGSPIAVRSWTLGPVSPGTPFPSEVATVLSFHADLTDVPETQANPTPPPATIRPAARRRGRIFLGPLQNFAGAENSTTHEIMVNTNWNDTLVQAAAALKFQNDATWEWVVTSNALGGNLPVEGGYVDNAFDTQRRRGQAPTARSVWI